MFRAKSREGVPEGRIVPVRLHFESHASSAPSLRAERLAKRFAGHSAVTRVDLELMPGEALGLLGPNGAGKTTTLRMLAGLIPPDDGEIRIAGLDPRTPEGRRRLGVAPQELAIYPELTVEENLVFFGRLHGVGRRALRRGVEDALELAGLAARRDRRAYSLSGGMQRRLNLACALVHEPSVLLLDEPTAGVDAHSRHHLGKALRSIRAGGASIVYSTHHLEEAAQLCDRLMIIDRGRVVAEGTAAELVRRLGSGERTLRVREEATAPWVRARGESNEAHGLEQVLLALTGQPAGDP